MWRLIGEIEEAAFIHYRSLSSSLTTATLYSFDSLHCNNIGEEGAKALAEALKHNSTLKTLLCDDEMRMWMTMLMGCVDGLGLLNEGGCDMCVNRRLSLLINTTA